MTGEEPRTERTRRTQHSAPAEDAADSADLASRLARLEQRVQELEEGPTHQSTQAETADDPTASDRAWLLAEQRRVFPDTDVVSLVGTADRGEGRSVEWQWSRPTEYLLEHDFSRASERLNALSHPVRLSLLQAVLDGTETAAGLARLEGMGTSGQVYHHLNQLAAGGWLVTTRRGHWQVPPERMIPLLTIIMAATD